MQIFTEGTALKSRQQTPQKQPAPRKRDRYRTTRGQVSPRQAARGTQVPHGAEVRPADDGDDGRFAGADGSHQDPGVLPPLAHGRAAAPPRGRVAAAPEAGHRGQAGPARRESELGEN